MLNKLLGHMRQYDMLQPGDRLICAVSGGADSMALLFAMYLLAPKLGITVCAAHFNHGLRGAESDGDEAFVRDFCAGYSIPLEIGSAKVAAGEKGLEAAAREARYHFLRSLPGKVATAHTANDNAETVLMHMLRGTGLRGLGGIAPVNGSILRPILTVTRAEVMAFLEEYHVPYVEDSSNSTDVFLRNRLRHHVMPLLQQENPRLAENLSAMALRLREDENALCRMADAQDITTDVAALRQMPVWQRSRVLAAYLQQCGVREPESEHIAALEELVFSRKPSARADFPGGIVIARNYGVLERCAAQEPLRTAVLSCPGEVVLLEQGLRILCSPAQGAQNAPDSFTVYPKGRITVRHRQSGDAMRLSGGTKSLKKLFIDRKIPAAQRLTVPVLADDAGILGVYGIGPNLDRVTGDAPGVQIRFEKEIPSGML